MDVQEAADPVRGTVAVIQSEFMQGCFDDDLQVPDPHPAGELGGGQVDASLQQGRVDSTLLARRRSQVNRSRDIRRPVCKKNHVKTTSCPRVSTLRLPNRAPM